MSQQTDDVTERDGNELSHMLIGFSVNRQLTYDLLNSLSEEDLTRKWPRPGLDSFAKQFQELAAVQRAFTGALSSGVMDFSAVPDVHGFTDTGDREALLKALREADRQMEQSLLETVKSSVRWDDIEIPAEGHLTNLISHEVFHQGQMLMMLYIFGLPVPESWATNWAVPASTASEPEE